MLGQGCSHTLARIDPQESAPSELPDSKTGSVSAVLTRSESRSDSQAQWNVIRPKVPHGGLQGVWVARGLLGEQSSWSADFEGQKVSGLLDPARNAVVFWFGVPYARAPGRAELLVNSSVNSGPLSISFDVVHGGYLQEVIQVDPRHVSPSAGDLKRIRAESRELGKVYAHSGPSGLWEGPFALPVVDGVLTSRFGTQRVFNGVMQSFHQGLDLRAPTGTPIVAPSRGKVVLAKDLFYTGNTVILDHGRGLFTVYAHLSELRVKRGQDVRTTDLLGLSGATGRASGPHLHWGALWNRVKFDPLDLVQVFQ